MMRLDTFTTTLLALIPCALSQDSSFSNSYKPLPTLHATGSTKQSVFHINATFGSPPQYEMLRVDTGQPYLWVLNGNTFDTCEEEAEIESSLSVHSSSEASQSTAASYYNPCISSGVYYIEDSPHAIDYNDWQRETFLNKIYVNGSVVQDVMSIDDLITYNSSNETLVFESVDFLNANITDVRAGALGLAGPIANELTGYNIYFLEMLKGEGLIETASYSYFAKDDTTLEVVFGGVNPNHFDNQLVGFDNIPYYDGKNLFYNYPIVPLTSMSVKNEDGGSALLFDETLEFPVLLDSRSVFTLLPLNTVINLAIQLNAYYSADDRSWLVKCSVGNLNAKISFQFGNLTVDVPVANMLREINSDSDPVVFDDGEKACLLGVIPLSAYGYSVLGANVLRSLYFAIDNESNKIALAQANNVDWNSMKNSDSITTSFTTTDLPLESSIIQSGTIPFAVNNNVTAGMTFSFISEFSATTRIPPEVSARITSGVIYTGRTTNATSSSFSSSTNAAPIFMPFDWSSMTHYSLLGSLTLIFFGFVL